MTAYHVQAAIAAVHAGAARDHAVGRDALALRRSARSSTRRPSSRSTAPWRCRRSPGRPRALEAIAALESDPALANYYLLPAVKGRLLAEMGDRVRAAAAFREALERPCSEPERRWLMRRLAEVEGTEVTQPTEERN